ncbi:hypothetical protein DPMN_032060 [Dreissena polymorpha]|uniref:Uncharacterized protein n=1 Tax=Dreissena polymorpha TaxID=45954 RepID=A0A9D4RJW9_DREPO|nr:hypothetical protein DPMN_028883 [Dreissena polymorpha]KAH3868781.1 hypothetical protein DPMN_031934 [Dreissena polymorpha]KAH3868905.1 hypothetical protein DPMN_032060 [Dreissena polymorpha]
MLRRTVVIAKLFSYSGDDHNGIAIVRAVVVVNDNGDEDDDEDYNVLIITILVAENSLKL